MPTTDSMDASCGSPTARRRQVLVRDINPSGGSPSNPGGFTLLGSPLGPDDYPADGTTAGQVAVGGSATGKIETAGDHDWFRIQLTAGVTYTIEQRGTDGGFGTLQDTSMNLLDGSGQLVTSNDDGNGTLNSEIVYTPTATGTFYVDAGAFGDHGSGT